MNRCSIYVFPVAALLFPAAHTASGQSPAADVPEVGIDQKLNAQVPLALELIDEEGTAVSLGELLNGKPAVIALVYYKCPMLCGQVLNGLLEGLRQVSLDAGEDFKVLAISIDPKESAALARNKKRKYVAGYDRPGGEEGWRFLTAAPGTIKRVTDAVGFRYTYDIKTQQFAHAAGVMILTPDGRVARYYYGIDYTPRDLRLGLIEASAGAIGTAVDQLLLLCFHYDPTRGKYGLAIMNTLRLAGAITVLSIASLIGFYVQRERLERRRALPADAREREVYQRHGGGTHD